MCVVSNVGDMYTREIPNQFRWVDTTAHTIGPPPSRDEFEALKRVVEQMRKELLNAKAQDIADGNPDCEMEDKVELLKRVAELVGVDLDDVFG